MTHNTGAGTIAARAAVPRHVRQLVGPGRKRGDPADSVEAYAQHCRPGLVRLLSALGLDVVYERGQGDTLWLSRDGQPVPILDLVGGYGANLFGHHHPELIAAARRCFDEQVPFHAQGSIRPGAARLAEAAKVQNLVLTHITEQFDKPGVRERVIGEMAKVYGGNLFFGEDLMEIPVTRPGLEKLM